MKLSESVQEKSLRDQIIEALKEGHEEFLERFTLDSNAVEAIREVFFSSEISPEQKNDLFETLRPHYSTIPELMNEAIDYFLSQDDLTLYGLEQAEVTPGYTNMGATILLLSNSEDPTCRFRALRVLLAKQHPSAYSIITPEELLQVLEAVEMVPYIIVVNLPQSHKEGMTPYLYHHAFNSEEGAFRNTCCAKLLEWGVPLNSEELRQIGGETAAQQELASRADQALFESLKTQFPEEYKEYMAALNAFYEQEDEQADIAFTLIRRNIERNTMALVEILIQKRCGLEFSPEYHSLILQALDILVQAIHNFIEGKYKRQYKMSAGNHTAQQKRAQKILNNLPLYQEEITKRYKERVNHEDRIFGARFRKSKHIKDLEQKIPHSQNYIYAKIISVLKGHKEKEEAIQNRYEELEEALFESVSEGR